MRMRGQMFTLLIAVFYSLVLFDADAFAQTEEAFVEDRADDGRLSKAVTLFDTSSCHFFVFQSGAGNWKDFVSGGFYIDADNGVYHGSNPDRLIFQSGAGNWKDFVSGGFYIDDKNKVCIAS